MKNYKRIQRLFEDETVMNPEQMAEPQTPAPAPAPMEPAPMPPALPAASTVSSDPMGMTVKDFIAKCKQIDPLVCLGIESFIEKNSQAFGGVSSTPADSTFVEPDITFSNQVPSAPVQSFSEMPADALDFPA